MSGSIIVLYKVSCISMDINENYLYLFILLPLPPSKWHLDLPCPSVRLSIQFCILISYLKTQKFRTFVK